MPFHQNISLIQFIKPYIYRHGFVKLLLMMTITFISCTSTSKSYHPEKKYDPQSLRADYRLMQKVLESKHPSLYWYTSKDSMDVYFDYYYNKIQDSMTERDFVWHVAAPMINKIHCGHTGIATSKNYDRWSKNKQFSFFPLSLKVWNDTMAVIGNMNRHDSIFKRGTLVAAINDMGAHDLIAHMLGYLREDGYAHNVNYIRISGSFPLLHRNIFGLSDRYKINYIDSTGHPAETYLPLYRPEKDSIKKDEVHKKTSTLVPAVKSITLKRSLTIDSTGMYARMSLNTFAGGRLRSFFRKSFKQLKNKQIQQLIIDLRSNGGGDVNTCILLTKYISDTSFRISDSCYALTRSLHPYTSMFSGKWFNQLQSWAMTTRHKDGKYHLDVYERKFFPPKKKNHFNGKVYVLVNGPTFSASTLFTNVVKGRPNVIVVGEETGGGWYGNNGIMLPTVTLPNTKTRLRMPLFRMVQYHHGEKTGTGIIPDVIIPTDYEFVKQGRDKKLEVVKQMILNDSERAKH